MTRLTEIAKRNVMLNILIRCGCFIALKIISLWCLFQSILRGCGIGGNEFKNLKRYKDRYIGKRCFIIAMGPSLTMEDLEKLKNEITFGMNSICKIFDQTDFRPTYYGIQDCLVYKDLNSYIKNSYSGKDNVFVSDRIKRNFRDLDKNWKVFPLNTAYNAYNRWFHNKFSVKISDDIYKIVYDGFSITISLLQIAMYMGFKEIYLIGADCNFQRDNLHFVNHEGSVDTTLNTAAERNLAGYKAAKQYADSNNIKIYNATRGGMLEIFERVNLDEILE
jgi:hypothetical protein